MGKERCLRLNLVRNQIGRFCCHAYLSNPQYDIGVYFFKLVQDSFKIQEKVYFCKCNNLEYVEYWSNNKGEYVNYEKEDIR